MHSLLWVLVQKETSDAPSQFLLHYNHLSRKGEEVEEEEEEEGLTAGSAWVLSHLVVVLQAGWHHIFSPGSSWLARSPVPETDTNALEAEHIL